MSSRICHVLAKVVLTLCEDIGTEVSADVANKLRSNDLAGIARLVLDPSRYSDPYSFSRDYACVELLRKCRLEIPGVDRKAAALSGFWSSESDCCRTNAYFSKLRNNGPLGSSDLAFMALLEPARAWVKDVLGPLPKTIDGRFGPGATYGDKGRLTTIPDKMSSRLQCTKEALPFVELIRESAWIRALYTNRESAPEVVRGNRFTTVPKDALKDRGICIEPSLNVFLQLGIGDLLKRKLRRVGIDLKHGQDLHRDWACRGSRDGTLGTIDLSNASDTVALELVRWLLPADWFDLLFALRSPTTLVEGKTVWLSKFSSMGNGFTFELETLIFAAICVASNCGTPGEDFLVYGDDMIVPTESTGAVLSLLKLCGFTPNERKTFVTGRFRESCGGDFFDGVNVRPHYLKELPHEPQDWIKLANGLRRLVCKDPSSDVRFEYPHRAWLRCVDALPAHIRRLRGPVHLGDLVIHDTRWESTTRARYPGWRFVRVYKPVHKSLPWHHFSPHVVLASALYGCPDSGVIPRGSVSGYQIGFVAYS